MYRLRSIIGSSLTGPLAPLLLLIATLVATDAASQPIASLKFPISVSGAPGDTVDVIIRAEDVAPGVQTGGFNLFFQYDTTALNLVSAEPGSLLTNCAWELFAWRRVETGDCEGTVCPNGLVHITALADYVIPEGEPLCWDLADGELVRLKLAIHDNPAVAGTSHSLRWYWYGCNDNEFSSKNGDSVYQSLRVFDADHVSDITADLPIPTTSGAPLNCATTPSITRVIDYYHGSILVAEDTLQAPVELRIAPQPLYALQANAVDPVVCTLYIGNLVECMLSDIDPVTIRLTDTIAPLGTVLVPPPDEFYGDVLATTFDARSVIRPLVPIWDTVDVPIAVSWTATEGCIQGASVDVSIMGHRSGDVTGDGNVNISDLVALIRGVFRGDRVDPLAGDIDGSGGMNVADITALIARLFR